MRVDISIEEFIKLSDNELRKYDVQVMRRLARCWLRRSRMRERMAIQAVYKDFATKSEGQRVRAVAGGFLLEIKLVVWLMLVLGVSFLLDIMGWI